MSQSQKWWSMGLLPLREELKSKGLETHGSKPVLVRRLEVYEERMAALKARSAPVQARTDKSPVRSNINQQPSTNSPGAGQQKSTVEANSDSQKKTVDASQTDPKVTQEEPKPKDWWTLSMQELKNECSARNLSFMGNKYTLVNRLKGYGGSKTQQSEQSENKPVSKSIVSSTPVSTPPKPVTQTKADTGPVQKGSPAKPAPVQQQQQQQKTTEPKQDQPKQDSAAAQTELQRIGKLTLAQLKIECVNKKLNITGSRSELLERLKQHLQQVPATEPISQSTSSNQVVPQANQAVVTSEQKRATVPVQPKMQTMLAGAPSWSPVAQKAPLNQAPQVPVAPVKKVSTSTVSVQTMSTEQVDRAQPIKTYYSDEQVEVAKKFSSKPPFWEDKNSKLPDVFMDYIPVKEHERRSRCLVMYPLTYKDIQEQEFNKVRQNARSCIITFKEQRSFNRALKGSVEMEFFTKKGLQNAQQQLKAWRKDLSLEILSQHDNLDGALIKLGMKPAKLESIANRLLFLNKLPMKLKEGTLAEKFSDAASISIAKDTLNVSKGYGFVEYSSSTDAQLAYNKNRSLFLEGVRIEVTPYPKVPVNLVEDKHKLVMPDSERVKLSEKHHQTTLDFNKAKSGPYNRDRTNDQNLLKEMSVLEEKLAVDAAIRKKLGYQSLPEPAGYMSTEMRKAWQTGNFTSFKVDLGGIHKDWGEPKKEEKPAVGPTPAKVSKMDDISARTAVAPKREEKMMTSLSATLSQLKEREPEERKRKEPPSQTPSRWSKPDSFKQDSFKQDSFKQDSFKQDNTPSWQQKQDQRPQQTSWTNQQKDSASQNMTGNVGWNQRGNSNQGGIRGGRNSISSFGDNRGSNFGSNQRPDNDSKTSGFGNPPSRFDQPSKLTDNKMHEFKENFPSQVGRKNQSSNFSDNQQAQFRGNNSFRDKPSFQSEEDNLSKFRENQSSQFGNRPGQQGFPGNQDRQFDDVDDGSFGGSSRASRFESSDKPAWGRGKVPSLMGGGMSFPKGRGQMGQDFEDKQENLQDSMGRGRPSFERNMSSSGFSEKFGKVDQLPIGRGKPSQGFQSEQPSMGRDKLNTGFKGEQSHFHQKEDKTDVYEKFYGGEDVSSVVNREAFPMSFSSTKVDKPESTESVNVGFGSRGMQAGNRFGLQRRQPSQATVDMDLDEDAEENNDQSFGFGQQSFGRGMAPFGQQRGRGASQRGAPQRGAPQRGAPQRGASQRGRGFGRGSLQQDDDDEDEFPDNFGQQMPMGRGNIPGSQFGRGGSTRGNFGQMTNQMGPGQFGRQGGNTSRFDNDDDDEEMDFGGAQSGLKQKSSLTNFDRNRGTFEDEPQGLNKGRFGQNQGNFNQNKPSFGFGKNDNFDESGNTFGQRANQGSFSEESSTKGQSKFEQVRRSDFAQNQRPTRFGQGGTGNQFMSEQEEDDAQQTFGYQNRGFQSSNKDESCFGENNAESFRRTPGAGARGTANQGKQYDSLTDTPKGQFGAGLNVQQEKGQFGNQQQNFQDSDSSTAFNNRQTRGGMGVQSKGPPTSLLGRPTPTPIQDVPSYTEKGPDKASFPQNQPKVSADKPPVPQQPPPQQPPPPPGQQQPPQGSEYPEYDQKAYEEYYKQYGYDFSQGYDYSQYGYGAYGQAGQGDWSQGYWGYPYNQPPPPTGNKPSQDTSQTQQPAAPTTDKTGQWPGYDYGQPSTGQQSASSNPPPATGQQQQQQQQPWASSNPPEQAQAGATAEDTVNTELLKKLGPAVSTLRQQMQYDNKEKTSDNMPTFVSNMASYSSNKTHGYGGQYGQYQ